MSPGARAAKHDQDVIRFFLHHPKLADTPAGRRALWRILHRLSEQIRTLQAARAARAAWPAHHALWLCIHSGEGRWDDPNSGGNGHYGGLQMTPGWLGIVPSGHTANEYSQLQQERWAEQGYAASGYSHAWLVQQWGQTIGPCWGFA